MLKLVRLHARVKKQLCKVPIYVAIQLQKWIEDVENRGVEDVRKIKGYHDEPLRGKRQGQRSIRLTRSYRAIYQVVKDKVEFIEIQEVSKHEY